MSNSNKGRIWFVVIFLFFLVSSIVYTLGVSLSVFINQVKPEHGAIYIGFLVHYGLMLIETILALIGVFVLLKNRRKNIFLLLSLLISCLEYIISGVKFTFLAFELGFTFSLGRIGLGINFIGLILLLWYEKLKDGTIETSSVSKLI